MTKDDTREPGTSTFKHGDWESALPADENKNEASPTPEELEKQQKKYEKRCKMVIEWFANHPDNEPRPSFVEQFLEDERHRELKATFQLHEQLQQEENITEDDLGTLMKVFDIFEHNETTKHDFHHWLTKIYEHYTPKTNVIYPWGDEDVPLVPDSVLERFNQQPEAKKTEISKRFPLLDGTCPNGRYVLCNPAETDRDDLRDLAEKQQITSALSFYDFYKEHKEKNDLPDTLPDTLLFDLMQFHEQTSDKNPAKDNSLEAILEKHKKILIERVLSASSKEEALAYQTQLNNFDKDIPAIKKACEDSDQSLKQFMIKIMGIEHHYSLERPFNLEWISERFREFSRGERDRDSVRPYEKCVTNAYVYFDPHSKTQTFDSLITEYVNANTTSQNKREQAHWWVIKDTKTGKVAGAFRYEGKEFDIGICSHDDFRGLGLIGAAVIETGIDIYRANPGAWERSTYHNSNENSTFVLTNGGYDDIIDLDTVRNHSQGHYYNEPRMITDRYINTFYGSSSFIKRTFNYLDIIASFEGSEISPKERLKLKKLGEQLKHQAKIGPGEERPLLIALNNKENTDLLFSVTEKLKENHPDLVDNIYGLCLSHLMRTLDARSPHTVLSFLDYKISKENQLNSGVRPVAKELGRRGTQRNGR